MFEVKKINTSKVNIKNLMVENNTIVDEDGLVKDLNKIVLAAFADGDSFDFTVQSKVDDSSIIEEDGEVDE